MISRRNIEPENVILQFGFDDGQSVLKLMQTVKHLNCPANTPSSSKRKKYSDGYSTSKSAPLSSVKKLFIICAVPNIDEKYHNVKQILDCLGIQGVSFALSCDLKMCLILCGKQTACSSYPCPFCYSKKSFEDDGELTTLGSLCEWYRKYQEAGAKKKNSKSFMNVVNEPLLKGEAEDFVIDLLNPPELHCMTGVTGKLVKEMEQTCFPSKEEGKVFMNRFLKENNILRCVYHGSEGFEGNMARRLLKSCDKLYFAVIQEEPEIQDKALPFVETLDKFNKVVESTCGQYLDPSYEDYITSFSQSYSKLGISTTLKVHIVMKHFSQFLERKGGLYGLGYYSEQAMESCHHAFKVEWNRNKVYWDHPNCAEKLFQTVVRFNSKNM